MLQIFLVINVTGLVEPTELGSVWVKFQLHLTSTCLLELLTAEYLRETNISIFILIYCFLFFRCREKGFEEKKTGIKMEAVVVLQQAGYRRKISG